MAGIIIALILGALIAYNVIDEYLQESRAHARLLEGTPTTRIADAREGVPAKYVGTVRATSDTLTSPLGGRSCVYYKAEGREERDRFPWGREWVAVFCEESAAKFAIEDASGLVTVAVWPGLYRTIKRGKALTATRENQYFTTLELVSWPSHPLPDQASARIEHVRRTHGPMGYAKSPAIRFSEDAVEVGSTAAIYGVISRGRLERPNERMQILIQEVRP